MGRVTITAERLCRVLWDKPIGYVSLGFYEGTTIPLRPVPADAVLEVCQGPRGWYLTDDDGGWIADRFGPGLRRRDVNRITEETA